MASGATPWFAFFSFSFSMTPSCSTTLKGLSEEVESLAVLSLPIFATSDVVSTLELKGTDTRMARGSIHSLPS